MVEVQDAIVRGGQIVIDGLPFPEGRRVHAPVKLSIAEVQRLLAGSVERFDDPTEPGVPLDGAM